MKIAEILSTPYIFEIESVPNGNGDWECVAQYAELPDCVIVDPGPLSAIDRLEERRLKTIFALIEQGRAVPVPRPPFREWYFALTAEPVEDILKRLGLGKWLDRLEQEVPVQILYAPEDESRYGRA